MPNNHHEWWKTKERITGTIGVNLLEMRVFHMSFPPVADYAA